MLRATSLSPAQIIQSVPSQLAFVLVVVPVAKLSVLAMPVVVVFAIQQRRHVNHDELVVVRHPKLSARRARIVVVVDHQQTVVVEHQHVFDGREREREHRVRAAFSATSRGS